MFSVKKLKLEVALITILNGIIVIVLLLLLPLLLVVVLLLKS